MFNVDMMCGGCEKAVTAMLKKVDGNGSNSFVCCVSDLIRC